MKKQLFFVALMIIVLALILLLSAQRSSGQGGYIELPAGLNYFLCWNAQEPIWHESPGGGYIAECPPDLDDSSFLPLVSSD